MCVASDAMPRHRQGQCKGERARGLVWVCEVLMRSSAAAVAASTWERRQKECWSQRSQRAGKAQEWPKREDGERVDKTRPAGRRQKWK